MTTLELREALDEYADAAHILVQMEGVTSNGMKIHTWSNVESVKTATFFGNEVPVITVKVK